MAKPKETVATEEEAQLTLVQTIVELLSPLTHTQRDRVLAELKDYRPHWFNPALRNKRVIGRVP